MGASLSRATRGGSSRTMSVFSVITPWYDVSIHGLCLFTVETETRVWVVCGILPQRGATEPSQHAYVYMSSISFSLEKLSADEQFSFDMHTQTGTSQYGNYTFTLYYVLGKTPPALVVTRHSHFANLPPLPVYYLLFFSSFKHSLQVSKCSAMLDQWPPLCCQQKTVSKAKSKQSSCAEGLIKAYNWITPPWAVCGTMPTHLPFVYRLMVKRKRKKEWRKTTGTLSSSLVFFSLAREGTHHNLSTLNSSWWIENNTKPGCNYRPPVKDHFLTKKNQHSNMWLNGEWKA